MHKTPLTKFDEEKAQLERMLARGTITREFYEKMLLSMQKQLDDMLLL
jgi:hypothetical protein